MSSRASSAAASPAYFDPSSSNHPSPMSDFYASQHAYAANAVAANANSSYQAHQPFQALQPPHAVSASQGQAQHGASNSSTSLTSPSTDFADLLAEFTLPGNALSPTDTNSMLGKSPGVSSTLVEPAASTNEGELVANVGGDYGASRGRQRERSAQELILEHIGFSLVPSSSATATVGSPSVHGAAPRSSSNADLDSAKQITNAIATMDPAARSQLLNALLVLRQQTSGNANFAAGAPSPSAAGPLAASSPRHRSPSRSASAHPSPREITMTSSGMSQNWSNATFPNSPLAMGPSAGRSSSVHASPTPFYAVGGGSNASTPNPYQAHHQATSSNSSANGGAIATPTSQPPSGSVPANYLHQIATSLPPSALSSPLPSPYAHPSGQHPQPQQQQHYFDPANSQQQQHLHAQLQAHDMVNAGLTPQHGNGGSNGNGNGNGMTFQNAFSPRPFDVDTGNRNSGVDVQAAMDLLARVGGNGGVGGTSIGGDMAMRGGSATGGSYATHPEGEDWTGHSDFMFSPLMSPAMTPQSVFTTASSLPPSGSYPPGKNALVSPAEFFSPLGSPAIMPQQFNDDPAAMAIWQAQQQQQQRNSLQGLVDQTRALGFDSSNIAAMAQYSPYLGATAPPSSTTVSPAASTSAAGMSPRIGPNDAGSSTAAGAGRRGAGSKKTRPSPLLKPTPDGQLARRGTSKKSATTGGDRRSASISSTSGVRSATTSPFLGPTATKAAVSAAMNNASKSLNGSAPGSQRTSPQEDGTSNMGIDTPSPVDLAMSDATTGAQAGQSSRSTTELMGPPPLPTSAASSRRSSFVQSSAQHLDASMMTVDWIHQAATPATFMNLPTDIAGVSSLSPQIGGSSDATQEALPSPPKPSTSSNEIAEAHDSSSPSTTGSTSSSGATPAKSKTTRSASSTTTRKLASKPAKIASKIAPVAPGKPKPLLAAPASEKEKEKAKAVTKEKEASKEKEKEEASETEKKKESAQVDAAAAQDTQAGPTPDDSPTNGSSAAAGVLNGLGGESRRTSHKAAEQKRRDSLKHCFEHLRRILPPIAMNATPEEEKRPGEGNVGGQRSGSVDPDNPNRGVSKVALLRRSNEYVGMLHERIERRDGAIEALRKRVAELRDRLGESVDDDDEIEGFELDALDKDEKKAGTIWFYENLDNDDDEEEEELRPKPKVVPKKTGAGTRRKSNATLLGEDSTLTGATSGTKEAAATGKGRSTGASRRSTRNSQGALDIEDMMDIEAVS